MLGKISLPPAEGCLKMADAGVFFPDGEQDLKAWNGADCLKNC